ncbi:SUKH-3 domain-containing protein, partial [Capnocytophaga gingivalis]|uniref:SUKH-3 domain-containing protein n=1 Tax=Capnocytophaga gingivalis TaxID=1017 RepID=UPI002355BD87
PHELVTFLTIFDGKEIKRRDGYMASIYSQNLPTRQEMLYYESDAGVTELIPFGAINADEILLCIDSVGSVWGVLDLTSWTPRKTYHYFYGGDLYTALENIIKGKVEETIIRP